MRPGRRLTRQGLPPRAADHRPGRISWPPGPRSHRAGLVYAQAGRLVYIPVWRRIWLAPKRISNHANQRGACDARSLEEISRPRQGQAGVIAQGTAALSRRRSPSGQA